MSFLFTSKPKWSTDQIVRTLENDEDYKAALKHLSTFGRLKNNIHGNSYLLYALAWGSTKAAIYLLTISQRSGLDLCDTFASSKSSPLILAAKTAANDVAMLLIGMGADLDRQDHLGYTALHYACLMRNEALIEALILAGADFSLTNHHGSTAKQYYEMDVEHADLGYSFGTDKLDPYLLNHQCDWDKSYVGTNNKHFSAFRWFIAHIVVNLNIGHGQILDDINDSGDMLRMLYRPSHFRLQDELSQKDVHFWMKKHLSWRKPVGDSRLYQGGVKAFIASRCQAEDETITLLSSASVSNATPIKSAPVSDLSLSM